jgi:hypothetical protein
MSEGRRIALAFTGSCALVAFVVRAATHGVRLANHHMDPSR